MKIRTAAGVISGIATGVGIVVISETREGRGLCLIGRHDWWYCEVDAPGHHHRHCRRCGFER